MIVSSLKINGFSCFKTGWNGFDEFKPINLIIGRNNTGKSRLIELVELLTKTQLSAVDFETNCTAKLDQSFLGSIFPENTSGGALSPSGQSHWSTHGKPSIGKTVSWTRRENNVEFRDPFSLGPYKKAPVFIDGNQLLPFLPRVATKLAIAKLGCFGLNLGSIESK